MQLGSLQPPMQVVTPQVVTILLQQQQHLQVIGAATGEEEAGEARAATAGTVADKASQSILKEQLLWHAMPLHHAKAFNLCRQMMVVAGIRDLV